VHDHLRVSGAPHLLWAHNASAASGLAVTSRVEVTDELRRLGWQVTLVLEGPAGQGHVRGVEVFCIPKPQVYALGYCLFHLRLLRLLWRMCDTVDIILFHQMSAPWVLLMRLARPLQGGSRPMLVMDTRDVNMLAGDLKNRLRVLFYSAAHVLANRWADGQTAITARMADWVGIPPGKLWGTWPSGADVGRFASAQTTRRWPLDGEPIHLMYVGALLAERNLLPLCRAVEEANSAGMELNLTVVGDGPARGELEEFARERGRRIDVLPAIPHEQISGLLARAHVGVTSLARPEEKKYQASSPIKLFEYMASGLPILATRNLCYIDVVGRRGVAFWAEDVSVDGLLNALRTIWSTRGSLQEMGRESADLAREWTWLESARKLSRGLERGLCRDAALLPPVLRP